MIESVETTDIKYEEPYNPKYSFDVHDLDIIFQKMLDKIYIQKNQCVANMWDIIRKNLKDNHDVIISKKIKKGKSLRNKLDEVFNSKDGDGGNSVIDQFQDYFNEIFEFKEENMKQTNNENEIHVCLNNSIEENIINNSIEENIINNSIEENIINNSIEEINKNNLIHTIKKRNSVEFNCTELVCAIILLNRNINNYDELIDYLSFIENDEIRLKFNNKKDFYEYVNDLQKDSKKIIIDDYIREFKNNIESINSLSLENIEIIYLSGKNNKHEEINNLNSGLSKIQSKSDLYIKLKNDEFIGLSVKQNKNATKSNYSVQKILGDESDKLLTKIKKDFLNEKGFKKFNKFDREQINKLFYPMNKENVYMNKLREEIEKNKEIISKFLIDNLYCSDASYDIYEFDGISLNKLVKAFQLSEITFEEHLPYYYNSHGEIRNAAKLFYVLICNDKKYRVEVRWKGNIHNASPQFQIHEE
jgi:hypothetical protein